MTRWQKFWSKLFGWQYIMEFDGGGPEYGLKFVVKRVYPVDGWYFKKGICNQLYPINRALCADTIFTLMESNKHASPGAHLSCTWTPLTPTLQAWLLMLPKDPKFRKCDVTGCWYEAEE